MIDLIEYFGGYEQAKEVALEARKGIDPVIYVNGEEVLIDFLTDQMLTYRRQNKIYEVGDLVVFSNSDETKPVLMKIKEFRNFNLVHLEIVSSGICGPSYKDDIRHANDVETTAGRRLDLPESVVKSLGEVS